MAVRTNQTETRDERGAALVEFAIIVPLFVMMLLGMFSGGVAYNQRLSLTHAAREGARYGAALPKEQANWAQLVRDVVVNRASGEITTSQVCVALVKNGAGGQVVTGTSGGPWSYNGNPSVFPANCFADDNTDLDQRVHVAIQRGAKIEWLVASSNVTLNAKATAKHEK